MADLVLYSYWRSSCSYRVRIALHLKQLAFAYQSVHLVKDGGEQKKPDYLAKNPMGQVPCLVTDRGALGESMAILAYLDAAYPQPALFPGDAWDRARIKQLCELINAGIQPVQNLSVLQELKNRFQADKDGVDDWVAHWISKGFQALETRLGQTAGVYAFGDVITAVDLFIVPQVYNAHRYHVDMNRFPILKRINHACLKLEAFQKADPAIQPDAPPS